MFRNYLKTAWRSLLKSRTFSAINIFGLAIGLASATLIGVWVRFETSVDQFHAKRDRLYLIYNLSDGKEGPKHAWSFTPKILATTLKQDYPEVEDVARLRPCNFLLSVGDKHVKLQGAFTDSAFFTMFSFRLLAGTPSAVLREPDAVVVTASTARKLFGSVDVVGKIVHLPAQDCRITGVAEDFPANSLLHFDFLLPWTGMVSGFGWDDDPSWGNNSVQTYLTLKPGVSISAFDAHLGNLKIDKTRGGPSPLTETMFAHPARDWHLRTEWRNGAMTGGLGETVHYLSLVALLIVVIACVNFMNLATARSERRAREVGVRKVLGASRGGLIAQFIGEALLTTMIAGALSLLITALALPVFAKIIGEPLAIPWNSGLFWSAGAGVLLLCGLVAGSYPALFLSAFRPVRVLKGKIQTAGALITPRRALVVFQFAAAIAFIIAAITIERQVQHVRERDAGYDQRSLVYVPIEGDIAKNYEVIRQALLSEGVAVAVNRSAMPMTEHWGDTWGFNWSGSTEADKKTDFLLMGFDGDIRKTLGVELVAGREIDLRTYPGDTASGMLNEAAVKAMRVKNPLGLLVRDDNHRSFTVVGVLKDFVLESPYEPVGPMIFSNFMGLNVLNVRLNPAMPPAQALAKSGAIFKQYNPAYPFDFHFYDEDYATKYADEQRTGTLIAIFSFLAVAVSCLGLFGLAVFMTETRVKEIGIRKVLGASVAHIVGMISVGFVKLVALAFLISAPLAAIFMNRWLARFSYRISIGWTLFALSAAGVLAVALLTVALQAIPAARANPVRSLRSE